MSWIGAVLVFIGGVVGFALTAFASKLISDELRARADALPAVMVEIALRVLRPEMRDYHRPEWEDDLAAFCTANDRFPGTKFVKSFKFAAGVLVRAGGIRWETRAVYRRGKQDEANERLRTQQVATEAAILWAEGVIDAHAGSRLADWTGPIGSSNSLAKNLLIGPTALRAKRGHQAPIRRSFNDRPYDRRPRR